MVSALRILGFRETSPVAMTASLASPEIRRRRSKPTACPVHSLQLVFGAELIELYLNGGVEKPHLEEQLPRHRGRFGKPEHLGKEIRQIKIEIAEGLNEFLDGRGFRVSEIDLVVQLFAQRAPVEIDEGMFLGDFLDDVVGDAGAVAKTSEMELLHFSAAAHIVHQIVGVSFATDKSHRVLESAARSRLRPLPSRSVRDFHYTYQGWMQRRSKGCKPPGWKHTCANSRKSSIGFSAAFHLTFLYARYPLFCTVTYTLFNTAGGERSPALLAMPLSTFFSSSFS